jgi:wobble nucleotide-excising tRNase
MAEFGRYNLIYGWNYSGKTTLGCVFQSIELGRFPSGFSGHFELELSDGTILNEATSESPIVVKVFNRDFVERNFQVGSDMTGASSIAVIGEANLRLKNRLALLETRRVKIEAISGKIIQQRNEIQNRLDNAATDQARIVNALFGDRYIRTHLLADVDQLPTDLTGCILDEPRLKATQEEWRKADDYAALPVLATDHSKEVASLLGIRHALKEVASNRAIERLKQNPNIEAWVNEGLGLHTSGDTCEFCGSPIPKSRWEQLKQHFSDAFTALLQKVRTYKVQFAQLNVELDLVAERDLFPELRAQIKPVLAGLRTSQKKLNEDIENLRQQIQSKLDNMESSKWLKVDFAAAKSVRDGVSRYNAIIETHNGKVASAADVRAAARKKIIQHHAANYVQSVELAARKSDIVALNKKQTRALNVITKIGGQITKTKEEIQNASIGSVLINKNLALLLPGDDIQAVKWNDTDFQFQRGGQPAHRMSDGERTAVAFAYYLAKLEEGTIPMQDMVLVIDDPISSLDANHLYAAHSIVEKRLAEAKQLFVLTHNAAFFGMVKDWMKKFNGSFYMTFRRLDTNMSPFVELHPLPRLLKDFKSDYQYTYYCLKVIDAAPSPTLESLCGVPNMIRRLLEAYLGFVFPERAPWHEKLSKVLQDEEKCGEIQKFADENSHSHSLATAMDVPDYITHCKHMVRVVLQAINTHNPAHVQSLETEFQPSKGQLP